MYCSGAGSAPSRRRRSCSPSRRAPSASVHLGDRRLLLADRDVDADHVLALLVDDRIDRDRGLAGLAIADDQLALTAADRDHRVDGLDARRHRLVDRLPSHDARGLELDLTSRLAVITLAVDRLRRARRRRGRAAAHQRAPR